jgi:hypothetical protein
MNELYRLEETQLDAAWDTFLEHSKNGTIFCSSSYLDALSAKAAVYYCYKNMEIRAAVAVLESDDGQDAVLHDFVIYNGIMFAPPTNRQNRSQRISEQFRIASYIAEELPQKYRNISISLHPSVQDIRPFLWVNYGKDLPQYRSDVRYTSYLDISDFVSFKKPEDTALFGEASSSRRQEIRYAIKKGVITEEEFRPTRFVEFYEKTLNRQGFEVENSTVEEMMVLLESLFAKGAGRMFVSYNRQRQPGSMAFFGIDSKRAYFIFGANDPEMRSSHTGSAVLWDGFRALSCGRVKEVDLEGINSPHRGWFKLSFGGDIQTYYELTMTSAK